MTETLTFTAPIWLWSGGASATQWHFVTIEAEAAEALQATALMRRLESGRRRGWGAIKVHVSIGDTHWYTSVFPQKSGAEWLLPIKAAVRKAEGLAPGDSATVTLCY